MGILSPVVKSIGSLGRMYRRRGRFAKRGGRALAGAAKTKLCCEQLEARVVLDGAHDAEHAAMLALVQDEAVTHTLVQDHGNWSDPSSWDNGVPTAGANVLIPEGMTVHFDAS